MYKRQDVATTLREAGMNDVVLTGGRYGLGSKDTPPSSVFAIYTELEKDAPKSRFTIGITDDVTNLSLPEVKPAPIKMCIRDRKICATF